MKFYFLKPDKSSQPEMLDWYKQLPVRHLTPESAHKIPRITTIHTKLNYEMDFPDIISYPRFMFANRLKRIIDLYEPGLIMKHVALFDTKRIMGKVYCLPVLERVACLSSESKLNLDKSVVIRAVLDRSKVKGKHLFAVAEVTNQYVVASLEVTESLLRRDVVDIELEEIELGGG